MGFTDWFFIYFTQIFVGSIISSVITLGLKLYLDRPGLPDAKKPSKATSYTLISILILSLLIAAGTGLFYFGFKSQLDKESTDAIILRMHEIHADVSNLRVDFEGLNASDTLNPDAESLKKANVNKVRQEAKRLSFRLLRINEVNLPPGFQILKFDHLSYVITIAAEVEDANSTQKRALIAEGLKHTDKVLASISVAKELDLRGESAYKGMAEWIVQNQTNDRIHSLRAWLFAIEALIDGKISENEKITVFNEINEISGEYRYNNPLTRNPSLRHFLQ